MLPWMPSWTGLPKKGKSSFPVSSWDVETGYLIGEIVTAQADKSILTDGKADLGKLRPIIFDPSFNAYRVIGGIVGKAFGNGLKLK